MVLKISFRNALVHVCLIGSPERQITLARISHGEKVLDPGTRRLKMLSGWAGKVQTNEKIY